MFHSKLGALLFAATFIVSCENNNFFGGGERKSSPAKKQEPQKQEPRHQGQPNGQPNNPNLNQPNNNQQQVHNNGSQANRPGFQIPNGFFLPPADNNTNNNAGNNQPQVGNDIPVQPEPPKAQPPQVQPPKAQPPIGIKPPRGIHNPTGAAIRVPVVGWLNMASKYQITNEGYRVVIEKNGKVLTSGHINLSSLIRSDVVDQQGMTRPVLLRMDSKYLAPEIASGQLNGKTNAQLSMCMPEDEGAPFNAPVRCRNLNNQIGHANGVNTLIRKGADIEIRDKTVYVTAVHGLNHANCNLGRAPRHIPCVVAAHPVFGFAVRSGDMRNDNESPLVLDLNKNGKIDLVSPWKKKSGLKFDLNGDGKNQKIGWVAKTDGLLAIDLNGNGKIDNGTELFGERSAGKKQANGFEALRDYDSNNDHVIDAKDAVFAKLVVWQDLNYNGKSEKSELKSMKDLQIKNLSLDYKRLGSDENPVIKKFNLLKLASTYTTEDGKSHKVVDVWFNIRMGQTLADIIEGQK